MFFEFHSLLKQYHYVIIRTAIFEHIKLISDTKMRTRRVIFETLVCRTYMIDKYFAINRTYTFGKRVIRKEPPPLPLPANDPKTSFFISETNHYFVRVQSEN